MSNNENIEEKSIQGEELNPCPFCGGEVGIIKHEYIPNHFISYSLYHADYQSKKSKCILSDFISPEPFADKEELIKLWNTRNTNDETPAIKITIGDTNEKRMICPKCGNGLMIYTEVDYETAPSYDAFVFPQYIHKCNNCGFTETYHNIFR